MLFLLALIALFLSKSFGHSGQTVISFSEQQTTNIPRHVPRLFFATPHTCRIMIQTMVHNEKLLSLIRSLLLLMCLCISSLALADDVSVQGSAPRSVAVGDRFQLAYTVNDVASDIILPDLDGFSVLMGPSSSTSRSYQFINGTPKSSSQTVFTYVLRADKTGSFTVPAAKVTVDGKTVQSNSLTINVVEGRDAAAQSNSQQNGKSGTSASSSSSQSGDLFVEQSLTKQSVYEGEGVDLVTKVYTRVNLNSLTDKVPPKLSDFVVSDITGPIQFHSEVVNGLQYQVGEIDRKVIVPQKSGRLVIEPTEIEFLVKKRVSRGMGGFFDDFFDDVQLSRQRVKSKSVTLNVKPLPQNKPAKFSGGVGQYKFRVSVDPSEVEVDNSVQVKVTVEGQGNLKLLSMPKPQFHQDFDTFDPSSKGDVQPCPGGYKGKRTDEYLIIPRRDGQFEIPQIAFSYFDTQKGNYVTLTQGPFTIKVAKGNGSSAPQQSTGITFSGSGPEQVTYTGSDLRYLHRSGELKQLTNFFIFSPIFWVLTVLPLGVLCALAVYFRKQNFDMANAGLVKSRKANKVAIRRLRGAQKFIKADKREAFFDEVMRVLWGYLSDKLTMSLSELTKDNAKEKMAQHGVDQEAADEFMALLDECEFARYAPASLSSSMDDVFKKAVDVITNIESCKSANKK